MLALMLALFVAAPAHAATTPTVNSFSASPTTVENFYGSVFSWNTSDSNSGTITFTSCAPGVSITNASGAAVACDSPQTTTNSAGTAPFNFFNVSGTPKSVLAKFIPNNTDGTATPAAASTASLTVTSAFQTITDFSASPTSIISGGTVTLTWTGVYAPGVNLQFDCTSGVTVFNGTTQLPCGSPAFASDLALSGSQTVVIKNTSGGEAILTARILPAIVAGSYDGTHAKTLQLSVGVPAAAASASATSFTSSASSIVSGGSLTLLGVVANATGANIQFSCGSDIKIMAVVAGATTTLPCYSIAFATPLMATSTTTIWVTNSNIYPQVFTASLLPQDSNGIYLGTVAKSLSVTVLQAGASAPTPTPAYVASTTPTNAPASAGATGGGTHTPLSIGLERGSKNVQVTILQTFLALDKTIYPEGTVSGYFGALTEAAVIKFQVKYGLAKPGDSGYGYVGPKTRAKINSLN